MITGRNKPNQLVLSKKLYDALQTGRYSGPVSDLLNEPFDKWIMTHPDYGKKPKTKPVLYRAAEDYLIWNGVIVDPPRFINSPEKKEEGERLVEELVNKYMKTGGQSKYSQNAGVNRLMTQLKRWSE